MSQQLQSLIEQAWEDRANLSPAAMTRCPASSPATRPTTSRAAASAWCRRPARGSFIGKNAVLMPRTNIGATDEARWSTPGPRSARAQIGKNVHLSGGVGIGGVLEPLQANPVIIEDNCFIGARSEVVEGVIVEENSVISMGVYLGQSTKIYDRETGEVHYGRVPARWWCRATCRPRTARTACTAP